MVYLVRSPRTYARIRSLTTGTFNLVVKDRIAVRRSGANSVQANSLWANPQVRIRLSSKPYKHTVRATPCQRPHPTEFPRVFHIGKDDIGKIGTADRRAYSHKSLVIPNRAKRPARNLLLRRLKSAQQ